MECNKDEAMRAKDIAIRKFTEKDFAGAKKFALKAQALYSGLDGIAQMIATLEVYLSAENKINGEMDMYGVLGVTPLADDETIKKQYRRLLLQLHPDKNKFVGADGAFQLVSEAFNFLSDKVKRSAYNNRRNVKTAQQKAAGSAGSQKFPTHVGVSVPPFSTGRAADQKVPTKRGVFGSSRTAEQTVRNQCSSSSQQKVPNQSGCSAAPSGANGHYKNPSSSTSRGKASKNSNQKASPSPQSFFKKDDTFWTMCTRCKMQYEYMRVYLNQILKCPHCQVGFAAVEVPPPSNLSPLRPQQHRKPSSISGPKMSGFNNSSGAASARWSPMFGTTTYNSTVQNNSFGATSAQNSTSVNGQASRDQPLTSEKFKKGNEAAKADGKRERSDDPGFVLSREDPSKKRREMDDCVKNSEGGIPSQSGIRNWENGMGFPPGRSIGNSEAGRANFFTGFSSKFNDANRELSGMELRKMLSEKALVEIRKKIREWKLAREARTAAKEKEKAKQKERQKSKLANDVAMQELGNHTRSPAVDDAEQVPAEMITMTVPDPDFHVFDLDRSESCFGENQVWAAYDNDDGMPRFYAMIHEVVSLDPFKVRLSWLNSKSNIEFGSLDWVGHGFIKTCGDFWVGKRKTNNSLNSFSHKVRWVKGPRGVIQIYPKKGEIWAVYKNWSPDWNKDTPENVVHAYDMVEVLDDYNEDQGVRVAPLVKAAGFLVVFSKQPDLKEVMRIPKEEMFRFSHQVPSHVLTGEEGPNAPKGYIELDPAATPSDLLQLTEPGIKERKKEAGSIAE
ncbi:hypothetical protein BVRB_3g052370 [Beta vulgaris subsp. vulgaris]|uniref:uncharacterized protein LOC104888282 n=1 Tax=Beta vulgaris subsp. vulgaris TaxID=3555 RepID=UPI00053F40E3|nr:uncharacterized protein LOC104888282 [Beta vulgaris subsp. vulgaris]KMT16066.1 hypothetical protein BVRB_3g052370 [Beta vulgaris subsp. vulgaris]